MSRKYISEWIGTFVLLFMGCGTAMPVGCSFVNRRGCLLAALAFGFAVVGMAYCVGNISGCHINPAVSLGVLLSDGMKIWTFVGYLAAQCLGALAGAVVWALVFDFGNISDMATGLYGSSNTLAGVGGSVVAGLIAEILPTFIFVLVVLDVMSKNHPHGSYGGLVIGLTLTLVHIWLARRSRLLCINSWKSERNRFPENAKQRFGFLPYRCFFVENLPGRTQHFYRRLMFDACALRGEVLK